MDNKPYRRWKAKVMQLLLIFVVFSACMKLEEREVLLDNYCNNCQQMLQDSLLSLKGIYFVEYLPTSKSVKIKYDSKAFELRQLHDFLGNYGFLLMGDSASNQAKHVVPPCCKTQTKGV